MEAVFDPDHSTFDIWVDGKEVPDLHRTDWQQDPLGAFHFGYEIESGMNGLFDLGRRRLSEWTVRAFCEARQAQ